MTLLHFRGDHASTSQVWRRRFECLVHGKEDVEETEGPNAGAGKLFRDNIV